MVQFTVTIQVDNINKARDYFEFWVPCTKELFTVCSSGVVYKNKEDSSPTALAYTQIIMNIHLQGCEIYNHILSIPPSHLNRYPVCIGCRRLDGPSGRIMSELYITPQQLRSSHGPILFNDGTNAQLLIDSPQFNLMTQPSVDVKPPESVDIGTYYQGPVITDDWLQETYTDTLYTLGRMATEGEVEDYEFQELLMVVCSETLTRGEYVNETDHGFHGFSNGLSPCVQTEMDCAIGVYQIYMSIYFGEFTRRGSKRMQLVAHELGYPMLTLNGHRIIFRKAEEDRTDYFFNIPYGLTNAPDVLDCFHVFSVKLLSQDTEDHEFGVYCHARTLVTSFKQRDAADACLVYTYKFHALEPKHNSIDSKKLCFVRPIIPLEYRDSPVFKEKNFPVKYSSCHFNPSFPSVFVPRLPDNLGSYGFAFISPFGNGFCINSPSLLNNK